ncbi:hypothetical protein J3Q64DRAFT_1642163, partial [Phycomyces blakesleeanus]
EIVPNENSRIMFENLIRSNRLLTYLLFYRRKSLKKEIELKSEHLDIEEVRLIYKLLSLNSCRKSVFMARQRTPEIIAHILTNGGSEYYRNMRRNKNKKKKKKYMEVYRWQKYESQKKFEYIETLAYEEDRTRVLLIVLGDVMFGKDLVKRKRNRRGVISKLFAT